MAQETLGNSDVTESSWRMGSRVQGCSGLRLWEDQGMCSACLEFLGSSISKIMPGNSTRTQHCCWASLESDLSFFPEQQLDPN